ncbi:MAG: ubiquitin-like domain-containing protein [Promethearchaeota archaeon]
MSFDEFDEDLEIEEEEAPEPITSKTPASKTPSSGRKISVFFLSTIGPGEKKQKLTVNDGNLVSDIKRTVGNIFGLNPDDFHLSSGGVTMDENRPLGDYNISNGDDILLIPASTAGLQ